MTGTADKAWRAFDAPGGDGLTDCEDLDPDVFGEDVVAGFAALKWGVGVGAMTQETIDWLEPQVDDLGEYIGGTLHVSDYLGEDVTMVYGTAYEVEGEMEVVVNADGTGNPILAGQVEMEGLATGWYTLSSGLYWMFN